MDMKDMSVAALSELTASALPAPGGGSISALAGAFGASLICMAARLTIGKKGYEDAWDDMRALLKKAEPIREALLEGIEEDADAFGAVMAALSMRSVSGEEKAARRDATQKAVTQAAAIPLTAAEKAAEMMELSELAVRIGNKNAVTDALVAAILCSAAVRGAVLNVLVNLDSLEDQAAATEMRARCASLRAEVTEREAEIFALYEGEKP